MVPFYHGTNVAIHESPYPFLAPERARLDRGTGRGPDDGDPEGPYVFLTQSVEAARLFSVKSENQIASGLSKIGAYLIFASKPEQLDEKGYVYTIDQTRYSAFQQVICDGRLTSKWFSRQRIDVTEYPPMIVRGLRELIERDGVRVYYLRRGNNVGERIVEESSNIVRQRGYVSSLSYLAARVASGELGLLNEDG